MTGAERSGAPLEVAVLMGGASEEREVSLASGTQVARALREAGHRVVLLDTSEGVVSPERERELLEAGVGKKAPEARDLMRTGDVTALTRAPGVEGVDVVFPVLHGGSGEDGTLQALLDLAGLPYAGSGRVGCTLSMDKEITKRLLREAGIPTPDWLVHPLEADRVVDRLGLPVIVKPPSGGSTLGLTLAHDEGELEEAVRTALRFEPRVLFERYVKGREVTVGIVGDEALPVGEIIPRHEIFDYECKYQPGMAEEIFPARLPPEVSERAQTLALRVHRTLFLRDFSRVDFILDPEGELWCLEANALPGMTANSLLPKAASAAGIGFPRLCEMIVEAALARLTGAAPEPGTRTRAPG